MSQNSAREPETIKCFIWPDFQATVYGRASDDGAVFVESHRAGGSYAISPEAIAELEQKSRFRLRGQQEAPLRIPNFVRVKLTTWLVDQMLLGDWEPVVTPEVISSVRRKGRLPVHERANKLLWLVANETQNIGDEIGFQPWLFSDPISQHSSINLMACAWSESYSWEEVKYLLDYLVQQGLLQQKTISGAPLPDYMVTVEGYAELARQATATDSAKAFVAMWFHDSMNDAYCQGFETAIKDAGYEPVRIDNVEHAGQIEDAIIAEIRKSRFVIVDLTQGDDGARGGVYYEAGFAHGLGLTVIFTRREDKFSLVHFDANHQAHILWSSYEDLRTKLRNRIEAVVGPGPMEPHTETP